ncbi:hypothetical protein ACFX2I_022596 [Malus domestica]
MAATVTADPSSPPSLHLNLPPARRGENKLSSPRHLLKSNSGLHLHIHSDSNDNNSGSLHNLDHSLPLQNMNPKKAQEQTSSTNKSTRTPIATRKGPDKHMLVALRRLLDAKIVSMGDPAPSGQVLLHKRKMKMVSGCKGADESKVLSQSFEFDNIV